MDETRRFRHSGDPTGSSKDRAFVGDRNNPYMVALAFLDKLQKEGVAVKDISYISQAMQLAFQVHMTTPLRRNGDPFITHPLAVLEQVMQIQGVWNPQHDPTIFREGLARAVLHDVIEEVPPGATPRESWERQEALCQTIETTFGKPVADGTMMLTKKKFTPDGIWKNPTYFSDIFHGDDIVSQSIKAIDRKNNLDSSAALDLSIASERDHALRYAVETRDQLIPLITQPQLLEVVIHATNHLFTRIETSSPRSGRHPRLVRAV